MLLPRNQKEDQDEVENGHAEKRNGGKKYFCKVMWINTDRVQRGVIFKELKNEMKQILSHINTKRIQAAEFNQDKADPLKQVLQIDYALAYTCEYQNEVQSVLWGGEVVLTFLLLLYHIMVTLKLSYFVQTIKSKINFRTESS